MATMIDDTIAAPTAETRGFPELRPADAPEGLERFAAAVRRLQDLTVSTKPAEDVWTAATEQIERVCDSLEPYVVPDGQAPAGRVIELPGMGHPLMPPWTFSESSEAGVTMEGHFTRYHVGGNMAVHGGVIPLFYDWQFGMIVSAAGRPISRTAYLHVEYRAVTPIEVPLISRGHIERIDGRKAFITATMTDPGGKVLSEATGLMIKLLPHQP
jgi:acyl-coenzyme A thioesterase PaaI-like protein